MEKAVTALAAAGISGEVIVADNGSVDGSQQIARRCGARVVEVHERGVEVLGFPCNQFRGQEPLDEQGLRDLLAKLEDPLATSDFLDWQQA